MPGIAQPAQIHLVSCCASTDTLTRVVLAWLVRHLRQPSAGNCFGPGSYGFAGGLGCMAFGEPSCRHVLVLFKGAGVPIDPSVQTLPELEQAKNARRSDEYAMTEFICLYCSAERLALNRSVVLQYRTFLEQKRLATAAAEGKQAA